MAVVLTETSKTHYHIHRILMPDDSTFVFRNENDAELTPAGELSAKQTLIAEPISSTSDASITDSAQDSKPKMQQIDLTADDTTAERGGSEHRAGDRGEHVLHL